MDEVQGRKAGAAANAVMVLLFAVLALGSSGAEVDHAEVRPWGCRTCPIPSQLPPPMPGQADPVDGPGLGPSAPGVSEQVPESE